MAKKKGVFYPDEVTDPGKKKVQDFFIGGGVLFGVPTVISALASEPGAAFGFGVISAVSFGISSMINTKRKRKRSFAEY